VMALIHDTCEIDAATHPPRDLRSGRMAHRRVIRGRHEPEV
jgi:hypothetical protein